MLKAVFLLVCVVSAGVLSAQQTKNAERSAYIKRFPDHFFIWPVLKVRTTAIDILSLKNSGEKLVYKPNNSAGLGIGLYIFEIGAELVFSVPIDEKKKELYGTSKANDLQLNVLGKNWGVDLFSQSYTGFYRTDSKRGVPPEQPYPQRPDMHTSNVGINGIYAFNKNKFSLRSSYNFSEQQLRSGGSFVLSGTLNFFSLKADSSLYGKSYEPIFGSSTNFKELSSNTLSISPGYSYNLVVKKFFVNASLSVGPAQHWVSYIADTDKVNSETLNTFADFRLGIGYNGDVFFIGSSYVQQSRNIQVDDIRFTSSSATFKLLIGYRFREVGILKKRVVDLLPKK